MQLHERPAHEIADGVRAGTLSALEVVDHHLKRIETHNAITGAMVFVDAQRARSVAADIDARVRAGEDPGRLAGVPLGIKELEPIDGWPATSASTLFRRGRATSTSLQCQRLLADGAVPMGQTASPEFGMLGHTNSVLHGPCRNPWNPALTPGGSSGGAGAALAAGLVTLATGSDMGGSIRVPASACGVVGVKGTFGLVPRGPGWLGNLDIVHYGPLARTVRDAARYLDVVVGPSERDSQSLPRPAVPFEESLDPASIAGLRIGVIVDNGFVTANPRVAAVVKEAAVQLAEAAGLSMRQVSLQLPRTTPTGVMLAIDVLPIANPKRYVKKVTKNLRAVPGGEYAADLVDMAAKEHTVQELAEGNLHRHAVREAIASVFDVVDLLVVPGTPILPFAAEGPYPETVDGLEVGPYGWAGFTMPFNLSGNPAVVVPAGQLDGLPVGMQIVARRHEDARALAAAAAWESSHPWPLLAPDRVSVSA